MEIKLPWGSGVLPLQVPDTWKVIFPQRRPNSGKTTVDELDAVRMSLTRPIGAGPLSAMDLKDKKIVIVVDDNTRPTPVYKYFHLVLEELGKTGADLNKAMVIPALGIHTPMTADEMAEKIGMNNLGQVSWKNHNAFDINENHFFGTTSRNTPLYLNKNLQDADLIILVGLIEPHNWAGFGGGLKCILPGLAHVATIARHHEIIAEPPYHFNRVGVLPEKNSFRLDLEETRHAIKGLIFCLNVVIDHNRNILASFAGDPIEAHREGMNYYYNEMGLHIDRPVDGIIVNSCPMDINFKQGMKCVGNSLPALMPGGAVMGFIRADRGLDDLKDTKSSIVPLSVLKTVLRLIGPARVRGLVEMVRKKSSVEEKLFAYYAMQLMRQYDLFIHVPTLNNEEVKRVGFFTGCREPAEVIRHGIRKIGKKATVAVFPEGGVTFPIVGE